jgi:chromosome segregation ATPase
MASNTSFEETFLDICKNTYNDCINEQFDKFKSMPVVKISPSMSIFKGINLIFRKVVDLLCENIQASIDKKTKIINDISKTDYTIPHKLDGHNIEQLLYKLSNFINESILTPLYEPNNNKLQNNDKILQILKSKICQTIEKISPLIQGQINKLIEDNKKLTNEFNTFKKNHQKEMQQKNDEINELKIKTEKQDRLMKEKELENMILINIEKEKYNQLEEKYNLEINEKNTHIKELTKNSINQINNLGGINNDINSIENQMEEALKNDYNDITNIFIKYKILVNKLFNDKDFFFENILIDKTLGDLRKKYPEIFGLLTEKESLEKMKSYYDKQIEILRNENVSLKEKNLAQISEINELKEKLDESNKIIDDNISLIESKTNIIKSNETFISGLENKIKECDIKAKNEINKYEQKEQNLLNEKEKNEKEIKFLFKVIEGIFSKQRNIFEEGYKNLNQQYQSMLEEWAKKFKWN